MNRLTYSLRRSLLMELLSKVSRRVHFRMDRSRSLSDTKLGLIISTCPVITPWDLAAGRGNVRMLAATSLFLGYWRLSMDVTV